MLEHLGASLRVLQFDKRGIGLSDRFESTPTLDERIGDVAAVMDAVGWQRAHVIGISEGADMAQLFATRFPERVDKLALLAPSGPFDDPARITELRAGRKSAHTVDVEAAKAAISSPLEGGGRGV